MSLIRVSFWCKLAISAEDSPNTFKECLWVDRGLPLCAAGVGSWPMEVSECWSWDASTTDVGITEWAVTWCGDAVFSSVVTANAFWDISSTSVSTWNIAGPSGSLLVSVSWYNGSFHSGWLGESISVSWRKGPFNVSSWLRKWGTRALSQYVLGISSLAFRAPSRWTLPIPPHRKQDWNLCGFESIRCEESVRRHCFGFPETSGVVNC